MALARRAIEVLSAKTSLRCAGEERARTINRAQSPFIAPRPAMDYSSLPNDPEHPGDPSPWASSPQHNRISFAHPPTSEIPSSPLPSQSPYGEESSQDHGYISEPDSIRPTETSAASHVAENGEQAHRQREPTQGNPSYAAQGQQQHLPPHGQQENQRHEPQRYHHTARQQRQHQPQYKLQAKITGLERTGRKDPILRFDVYVCFKLLPNLAQSPCSVLQPGN